MERNCRLTDTGSKTEVRRGTRFPAVSRWDSYRTIDAIPAPHCVSFRQGRPRRGFTDGALRVLMPLAVKLFYRRLALAFRRSPQAVRSESDSWREIPFAPPNSRE